MGLSLFRERKETPRHVLQYSQGSHLNRPIAGFQVPPTPKVHTTPLRPLLAAIATLMCLTTALRAQDCGIEVTTYRDNNTVSTLDATYYNQGVPDSKAEFTYGQDGSIVVTTTNLHNGSQSSTLIDGYGHTYTQTSQLSQQNLQTFVADAEHLNDVLGYCKVELMEWP
jgi:hypothetical protein